MIFCYGVYCNYYSDHEDDYGGGGDHGSDRGGRLLLRKIIEGMLYNLLVEITNKRGI